MDTKTPRFRIQWPEGAQLKMEKEHLLQIRKSLEAQFKYYLYSQSGFKNFHNEVLDHIKTYFVKETEPKFFSFKAYSWGYQSLTAAVVHAPLIAL